MKLLERKLLGGRMPVEVADLNFWRPYRHRGNQPLCHPLPEENESIKRFLYSMNTIECRWIPSTEFQRIQSIITHCTMNHSSCFSMKTFQVALQSIEGFKVEVPLKFYNWGSRFETLVHPRWVSMGRPRVSSEDSPAKWYRMNDWCS